eukprot:4311480-Pyramimonas_sp.AAC.1
MISMQWCFGRTQDYKGAAVTLIRGVAVPGMAFWHDSGSPRRNTQVDPWRWNPESNVLACFRIFKVLSSTDAVPSVGMTDPL